MKWLVILPILYQTAKLLTFEIIRANGSSVCQIRQGQNWSDQLYRILQHAEQEQQIKEKQLLRP